MRADVLNAKTHRLHVERIRSRVEDAMHRESERNVDVACDRLDLRIRAAVMTILDEELASARESVRIAEKIDDLKAAFSGSSS